MTTIYSEHLFPMYMAAFKGDAEAIKQLCSQGGDINAKDNDNWPPLFCATIKGHVIFILQMSSMQRH